MFSAVKNVRIKSLTKGARVQLRLGKAAVKSSDDLLIEATLDEHGQEGDKSIVDFKEADAEGNETITRIYRFPGAPWRATTNNMYVSLVGVDESTFTIVKAASPIQTDAIAEAVALVEKERDDVYAPDQLISLLNEIAVGKRVNTKVKSLANQLASRLVSELSTLPDRDDRD